MVEYLLLVICMLLPMLNFGQEVKQNPEVEKVLRLLNIHRDEQLTRAELKERLRLGRILQHVFQGDTMVFNPEHPDADANGYVAMPNVDLIKETTDSMAATHSYNANITAFNAIKLMAQKALEIGQ